MSSSRDILTDEFEMYFLSGCLFVSVTGFNQKRCTKLTLSY